MATNWIVPTADMLPQVIQLSVINKTDENIDTDAIVSQQQGGNSVPTPIDITRDTRSKGIISLLVGQFREAIITGGRFPVSVTPGAVPPTAARHVLNMAAFQLVSSGPNLTMVVLSDNGAYSPLQTLYKEGLAYLKRIEDGGSMLPPSDPCGADNATAVDPELNPAITAVFSAPINGLIDLSMDGELGGRVTRGAVPPNGSINGIKGDVYEQQNAAGETVKIWEKISSSGNTGWI